METKQQSNEQAPSLEQMVQLACNASKPVKIELSKSDMYGDCTSIFELRVITHRESE